MSDEYTIETLYVGCECMDLCHIALFHHCPLDEEDIEDGEEERIWISVRIRNYMKKVLPPIRYFYEKFDWIEFWHHNWYKRFGYVARYLFNSNYQRKHGILDCFDFQPKDFAKLDAFMAIISDDIDVSVNDSTKLWLDNGNWRISLEIERDEYHGDWFPWEFGWTPQFIPRGLFGRIYWGLQYIFGTHSVEQDFEISVADAAKVRGMMKWVQDNNRETNNE